MKSSFRLTLAALSVCVWKCGYAEITPSPPLLARGARVERVAGGFTHAEGPAWHPDGFLLFGDTPSNRILKCDEAGGVSVFRSPCGRATGLAWDPEGRLVAAESHGDEGGRRITRRERSGEWIVLADRYGGKHFNSPNDLAIDANGRIFFTDPRYSKRETMELNHESVYRLEPDGRLARVIDTLMRPNGILISPDGKTLYVADNPGGSGGAAGLWVFDVASDGAAENGRNLHDFGVTRGIDGMALDTAGRVWATAGTKETAGIYVFEFNPKRTTARVLAFIALPEDPTNCTFGGQKRDTLYITTDATIFRLRTAVTGQPTPPGK